MTLASGMVAVPTPGTWQAALGREMAAFGRSMIGWRIETAGQELIQAARLALMWTKSSKPFGDVYDTAREYLKAQRLPPPVADLAAALEADTLPGLPGPNPLRGRPSWVPVSGGRFPSEVQTRHACCLIHLREHDDALCHNWPYLPTDDRGDSDAGAAGRARRPAFVHEQEVGCRRAPYRMLRARQGPVQSASKGERHDGR